MLCTTPRMSPIRSLAFATIGTTWLSIRSCALFVATATVSSDVLSDLRFSATRACISAVVATRFSEAWRLLPMISRSTTMMKKTLTTTVRVVAAPTLVEFALARMPR